LLRDVVLVALFATLLTELRGREQEHPILQPATVQSLPG
jgi:hypothetical protein